MIYYLNVYKLDLNSFENINTISEQINTLPPFHMTLFLNLNVLFFLNSSKAPTPLSRTR